MDNNTPEIKNRERLIDAKVAGEMLGVSHQTVYRMVNENTPDRLPFIVLRKGKKKDTIRFRPSSLERWIKTREVK